jgi:AcrB/AcrD/AcrF family
MQTGAIASAFRQPEPRMANLSRPFIERPKATILLVAGFFALGVVAYFQLPISTLPDVDFPTIQYYLARSGPISWSRCG